MQPPVLLAACYGSDQDDFEHIRGGILKIGLDLDKNSIKDCLAPSPKSHIMQLAAFDSPYWEKMPWVIAVEKRVAVKGHINNEKSHLWKIDPALTFTDQGIFGKSICEFTDVPTDPLQARWPVQVVQVKNFPRIMSPQPRRWPWSCFGSSNPGKHVAEGEGVGKIKEGHFQALAILFNDSVAYVATQYKDNPDDFDLWWKTSKFDFKEDIEFYKDLNVDCKTVKAHNVHADNDGRFYVTLTYQTTVAKEIQKMKNEHFEKLLKVSATFSFFNKNN